MEYFPLIRAEKSVLVASQGQRGGMQSGHRLLDPWRAPLNVRLLHIGQARLHLGVPYQDKLERQYPADAGIVGVFGGNRLGTAAKPEYQRHNSP